MTIKNITKITGVKEGNIEFYIRLFEHEIIRNNGCFIRYDIPSKEVPFIKWWFNIGRINHKKTGKTYSWKQKIRNEFLDYYGITERDLVAK